MAGNPRQAALLRQLAAHPDLEGTQEPDAVAWALQDDFQGDMSEAWISQTRPLGQSMLQQLRQDSLAATELFNAKVGDPECSSAAGCPTMKPGVGGRSSVQAGCVWAAGCLTAAAVGFCGCHHAVQWQGGHHGLALGDGHTVQPGRWMLPCAAWWFIGLSWGLTVGTMGVTC